jgi:DNA-directed RNA polymerase specialized sigma24 family protein
MRRFAPLIEWSVRVRPDAFAEVARRHEVVVHSYLARRAGRQVADDLLAEVWLRAFAARGGYDTRYSDARPWLYGIARNVLREQWRTGSGDEPAAGQVPIPEPRVLQEAREALWSAIASEMLGMGSARETHRRQRTESRPEARKITTGRRDGAGRIGHWRKAGSRWAGETPIVS